MRKGPAQHRRGSGTYLQAAARALQAEQIRDTAGIAVAVWLAGGERIRSRRFPSDFLTFQQQLTLASWLALDVQGPSELRVPAQSPALCILYGMWQDVVLEGCAERTRLERR